MCYFLYSSTGYKQVKLEHIPKQEPMDISTPASQTRIIQPVPIKLEDLDGIGEII